jgi:hypothetical protein
MRSEGIADKTERHVRTTVEDALGGYAGIRAAMASVAEDEAVTYASAVRAAARPYAQTMTVLMRDLGQWTGLGAVPALPGHIEAGANMLRDSLVLLSLCEDPAAVLAQAPEAAELAKLMRLPMPAR